MTSDNGLFSSRCGYNPALFEAYFADANQSSSFPPDNDLIVSKMVEYIPKQSQTPDGLILDLKTAISLGMKELYVKKHSIFNTDYADIGVNFSTSEIVRLSADSESQTTILQLVVIIVVGLFTVVGICGMVLLGKKILGDKGEEMFDREERIKSQGFEMVQPGPIEDPQDL